VQIRVKSGLASCEEAPPKSWDALAAINHKFLRSIASGVEAIQSEMKSLQASNEAVLKELKALQASFKTSALANHSSNEAVASALVSPLFGTYFLLAVNLL
jgi:hypothetical protein